MSLECCDNVRITSKTQMDTNTTQMNIMHNIHTHTHTHESQRKGETDAYHNRPTKLVTQTLGNNSISPWSIHHLSVVGWLRAKVILVKRICSCMIMFLGLQAGTWWLCLLPQNQLGSMQKNHFRMPLEIRCECEWLCDRPATYSVPHLCPTITGMGSSNPVSLTGLHWVWKMNGWYFLSSWTLDSHF